MSFRRGVQALGVLLVAGSVTGAIVVLRHRDQAPPPAVAAGARAPAGQPAPGGAPGRAPAAPRTTPARPTPPTPTPPRRAPAVAAGDLAVDPARIPTRASGDLVPVPGSTPARGPGRTFRYRLEIEAGLPFQPAAVAAVVQRDLTDRRGWQPIEHVAFERTSGGAYDLRVIIASPATTDSLCRPLDTAGELSCRNGGRVVLNALRWAVGIPGYRGDLVAYHAYMVNHEVGHALGHSHARCTTPGRPAPVMMQQTKGLGACLPNPWPAVRSG